MMDKQPSAQNAYAPWASTPGMADTPPSYVWPAVPSEISTTPKPCQMPTHRCINKKCTYIAVSSLRGRRTGACGQQHMQASP